jgi:hypothetical protein
VSRLADRSLSEGVSIDARPPQSTLVGKSCHDAGEEVCAGRTREAELSPFPLPPHRKTQI